MVDRLAPAFDDWLVHAHRAAAALAAAHTDDADAELTWCLDRSGRAELVTPAALAVVPAMAIERARLRQAAHARADVLRAGYQAVVELGASAQHDPWTDGARAMLQQLHR
jgi:hypothetical protein